MQLVMNNFLNQNSSSEPSPNAIPKHLEKLTTTVFQSLFPPISPQTTPLSSIRRVLLINRESESANASDAQSTNGTYRLTLRHYAITTRTATLSKPLRRLEQATSSSGSSSRMKPLPNLGKLEDVADYLLEPEAGNYTSGSESEVETDAEVEVLQEGVRKVLGRRREATLAVPGNANTNAQGVGAAGEESQRRRSNGVRTSRGTRRVEKRAVKLIELGPRLSLRLTKVEEGLCSGKVMWHETVRKTGEEEKELEKVWEERRREKERRRKEQKENVERKKKEKAERSGKEDEEGKEDGERSSDEDMEDWDMDDDEWYGDEMEEEDPNADVELHENGHNDHGGDEMDRDT